MSLIFLFIYLIPLIKSECLDLSTSTCQVCPWSHYDDNYLTNLKLSSSQRLIITNETCIKKSTNLWFSKVLITNSLCAYENLTGFDGCYENLMEGLQEESKKSLNYINGSVEFKFTTGEHYVLKTFLEDVGGELFRRQLVQIRLNPLNISLGEKVVIYLKTNEFFIFVSKEIKVENIQFEARDLEIINENVPTECYNSLSNSSCCSSYSDKNERNGQCYLNNKNIENVNINKNLYGLFNLEYIIDDPYNNVPTIILNNCTFSNFLPLYFTNGWGILISIVPFSVNVFITNITVMNSFFPMSIIYFSKFSYDSLYSLCSNYIVNTGAVLSFYENINIENLQIINYNEYHIENNDIGGLAIFNFFGYDGILNINNSKFANIYFSNKILSFANQQSTTGSLKIYNVSIDDINETSIIYLSNILFAEIILMEINEINSGLILFEINNIGREMLIEGINLNLLTTNEIFSFNMVGTLIKNSYFQNITLENSFLQSIETNLKMTNVSFYNIICPVNFFVLQQSNETNLTNIVFLSTSVGDSIFYCVKLKYLLLESFLIKETIIDQNIFILEEMTMNKNYFMFIMESYFSSLWSPDHTCTTTYCLNCLVQNNNISQQIFAQFVDVANILYIFESSCFLYNDFESVLMMSNLVGTTFLTSNIFIENIFLDTAAFTFVFDFEMDNTLYVNSNIFIDNGIKEIKTFFLSKDDNLLFCIWSIKYTSFSNNLFFVGALIELMTGFIEAMPHGGIIDVISNTFIIAENYNPNFKYKGVTIDHFLEGLFINNQFINMKCNDVDFYHSHGGVVLSDSYSFSYNNNGFKLLLENNSFINSTCLYGGALLVINIGEVVMNNNTFINSTTDFYGGHLTVIAGEKLIVNHIFLLNSSGNEGSGIYLQNFHYVSIDNLKLLNSYSRKNGGIFCKNLLFFEFKNSNILNITSEMNGGFIFQYSSFIKLKNLQINYMKSFIEGGGIFVHGGSDLYIEDSYFNNSNSVVGGVLSLENANKINIFNTSFINSQSVDKGAAIFVDVITSFLINKTNFINCSTQRNGILFVKTEYENSLFEIQELNCKQTKAKKGSCFYYLSASMLKINSLMIQDNGEFPIFVMWSFPISVNISSLTIKDTFVDENLVFISGVTVFFDTWYIFGNNASDLIFLQTITGIINEFIFENNQGMHSLLIENSELNISNFKMNNSFIHSFDLSAISSVLSDLNLQNLNISFSYTSNLIFLLLSGGNIYLENSIFSNNNGQILNLDKANTTIKSCQFINNNIIGNLATANDIEFNVYDNLHYVIDIQKTIFEINSKFSLGFNGPLSIILNHCSFNLILYGSAFSITITDAYEIQIISSFFQDFNQGNLNIYNTMNDPTKFYANSSNFVNISGEYASALYFTGNFYIFIDNCTFKTNQALGEISNKQKGIAPCVFFSPNDIKYSKLEVSNSYFISNLASYLAPTIFSIIPIYSINNTFINNNDSINFTQQFFAYPLHTQLLNDSPIVITSGFSFDLEFALLDYFNQKIIFDNTTVFILKPSINSSSLSLENQYGQINSGNIFFKSLKVKIKPNTNFSLTLSGLFEGLPNSDQVGIYEIQSNFEFSSRKCIVGEIILPDNSCYVCPRGTYSFIESMIVEQKYHKCFLCPINCICYGGKYVTPIYGYYRKTNISSNSVKCINENACIGMNNLTLHTTENNIKLIVNFSEQISKGLCKEGNSENLCFYCELNYGKYDKNDYCKVCADLGALVYVRLCVYFFLTILYILLNYQAAENSHVEKKACSLI